MFSVYLEAPYVFNKILITNKKIKIKIESFQLGHEILNVS
jgi:hypothetical protein